ncbi:MAG: hypothetical protein ACD_12C00208G0001, partial [uncultured bacterium]
MSVEQKIKSHAEKNPLLKRVKTSLSSGRHEIM